MEGLVLEGILLVDKPSAVTSFSMVAILRKKTKQPKVGHAGTLDPFATGLLVLLLGRRWTRLAGTCLNHDKEYEATLRLGIETDTYDRDGTVIATSAHVPSEESVRETLSAFQGEYLQTPPMFSAKKVGGKRLYDLARKGICIPRQPQACRIAVTLVSYHYPDLAIRVHCSKGTYVRSLAHDIGERLGCLAHVADLRRIRSGPFTVQKALRLPEIDQICCEELRHHLLTPGSV